MLYFQKKQIYFNKNRCMKCGICVSACSNGAIKVVYSFKRNFRILLDHKKCVLCGKCVVICPASKMTKKNVLNRLDYKDSKAYLAWHKNNEIRWFASSGGVARGLIIEMLESKKVDAVYCLYDDNSGKPELEGEWIIDSIDHCKIPTSIYRPVCWGKNIAGIDRGWKNVLVVGLPCQIKGAKTFFNKYYPHLNVFSIVIFCKKQKSQKMTLTYLKHFKIEVSRVKDFRYRGEGYPGGFRVQGNEQPSATFIYPAKAWYPFACRFCLDPLLAGEADIVLADPWQLIDREKEKLGKNLMIAQTKQAMDVLSKIEALEFEKIDDLNRAYFTSLTLQSYQAKATQAGHLANHIFDLGYIKERIFAIFAECFFWLFGPDSLPANLMLNARKSRN